MSQKPTAREDTAAYVVTPRTPWRVREVCALPDYQLHVTFIDGSAGIVDMSGLINSDHAGVFAALRDEDRFREVFVHCGAVTWPGELDLAPDAMHRQIQQSGTWILN